MSITYKEMQLIEVKVVLNLILEKESHSLSLCYLLSVSILIMYFEVSILYLFSVSKGEIGTF